MSASASDSSRLALLLESCRLRMTSVELEMVMEEQQRLLETRLLTPDSISTLSFEQLTAVGLSPGVSAALSRAFPSGVWHVLLSLKEERLLSWHSNSMCDLQSAPCCFYRLGLFAPPLTNPC